MRGTHTAAFVCSLFGMLVGVAHAQAPPPPPPPPLPGGPGPATTTEPIPSRWMGLGLVLVPSGSLKAEANGQSDSTSISSAYGLELAAIRTFESGLQLVVTPRYLSGIKASDSSEGSEAANQLDLRLGLGYSMPLSPGLYGNGVIGGGWSMIFPPDEIDGESYTPMGPIIAFGAGVTYLLGPRMALNASLGYQIGFHHVTINGVTGTLSDDLLDLTVRIMFATGS